MIKKTYTKRLLKEALLELLDEKPLEKISINEITKKCMIRRESFYYHFTDKYDLLRWIHEDDVYERLVSDYTGPGSWEYIIKRCVDWIDYFIENRKFVQKALKDDDPNGFHQILVDCEIKIMTAHAKIYCKTDKLTKEMQYYIAYYAHGNVCLCEEWIQKGMPESKIFIAEIMTNSVPGDLKKVYFGD